MEVRVRKGPRKKKIPCKGPVLHLIMYRLESTGRDTFNRVKGFLFLLLFRSPSSFVVLLKSFSV